ncbi:MAG: M48 family metalloprotease [Fimbriimonadales bacterium]|jgi:predicted Zn-dependent protease|nr:M48 family metalloprotease [Fimbriimonadales bacterium]GBC91402.1 Beta-barrel assembly-enhancing protease [bacterium HR14]CUU09586.1 Peptidase family M48 [Armatimonadetes bacterium GBS]CUU35164.1 Peptidase family M48 [Armatimonadetes bacterium GXS]
MRLRSRIRHGWGLVFVLALSLTGVFARAQEPAHPELSPRDKEEIELGKQIVAEIEKEVKFVNDAALAERVNRIGQTLAEIARRTKTKALWGEEGPAPFEYTFRIIDEKEVNAFSVPGGFIFIYKGLLDFVSSDDELAGVIAHEIAHADHRHVIHLLRRDAKIQERVLLPAILVGILGRLPSEDMANVIAGTQFYRIARMSSFSQEAETDADLTALEYLRQSPYNPVGLLVFMERLEAEERKRPQIDWGIFRTHPITRERVAKIRQALTEMGIPIRRREVSPALQVKALPVDAEKPEGLYRVVYDQIEIFTPANDSQQRAQQIAKALNRLLDDGLQLYEVQLAPDKQGVVIRGQELVRITPEDAQLRNKTPEEVAQAVREAIRRVLWTDSVRIGY